MFNFVISSVSERLVGGSAYFRPIFRPLRHLQRHGFQPLTTVALSLLLFGFVTGLQPFVVATLLPYVAECSASEDDRTVEASGLKQAFPPTKLFGSSTVRGTSMKINYAVSS